MRRGLAAWLAMGCVPMPHDQQRTPEVSGVLMRDGREAAGVLLHLQANPGAEVTGCPHPAQVAVSGADGRFVLPATSERLWVMAMGDRRDTWRVCADGAQVWQDEDWWGGPPRQSLHCDLSVARCEASTP